MTAREIRNKPHREGGDGPKKVRGDERNALGRPRASAHCSGSRLFVLHRINFVATGAARGTDHRCARSRERVAGDGRLRSHARKPCPHRISPLRHAHHPHLATAGLAGGGLAGLHALPWAGAAARSAAGGFRRGADRRGPPTVLAAGRCVFGLSAGGPGAGHRPVRDQPQRWNGTATPISPRRCAPGVRATAGWCCSACCWRLPAPAG